MQDVIKTLDKAIKDAGGICSLLKCGDGMCDRPQCDLYDALSTAIQVLKRVSDVAGMEWVIWDARLLHSHNSFLEAKNRKPYPHPEYPICKKIAQAISNWARGTDAPIIGKA